MFESISKFSFRTIGCFVLLDRALSFRSTLFNRLLMITIRRTVVIIMLQFRLGINVLLDDFR
jgi:hypothetical protein